MVTPSDGRMSSFLKYMATELLGKLHKNPQEWGNGGVMEKLRVTTQIVWIN